MSGIFRLVRLRTLAYAVLTMCAMRYFVILPILDINGFVLQMNGLAFILLVFAVCCLISAAYIINDYFDAKSDRISGVKENIVGRHVTRRTAITLHSVLNLIAIVIAFYLGAAVGVWKIGILFVLVSGLLWFYSSVYKKYFITGNVLVGIMAALIPLSVVIFEIPLLNMAYAGLLLSTDTNFMYLLKWVGAFGCFAFLNALMYEINKDIYTAGGDEENGACTLAVKWGEKNTRRVIAGLAQVGLAAVWFLYITVFSGYMPALFGVIGISLMYAVYALWVSGGWKGRKTELRTIRVIMIAVVTFSGLLPAFFRFLF